MKPRDDEGRRFSEDIEALLRGEEPLMQNVDVDYAETVEFARSLMQLQQEPDPAFARGLKSRLVVELAKHETEARASRPWFGGLFSRPGLRLAVASTVVVLAAVGVVWRAGLLSPMMPQAGDSTPGMLTAPPAPGIGEDAGPQMARVPDDANKPAAGVAETSTAATPFVVLGYVTPTNSLGTDIHITIEFRNEGPDGYSLNPFPPAVTIRETASGRAVYTSPVGTSSCVLSPMESLQYRFVWDQRDDVGTQVEPGQYEVDVEMIEALLEKGDMAVSAGADDVTEFLILSPHDGATVGTDEDTGD
jgi:hypothetical protein